MSQNPFSIENQVVVVSGAARGNGFAIAQAFSKGGAKVQMLDVLDCLEESASQVPGSRYFHADVTKENDLHAICEEIYSKEGRLDTLVNCAGISLSGPDVYDNSLMEKTFAVNFFGAFYLSKACMPYMQRQKSGAIINITSLGAELGFANNPSYVASKGALRQLGKAMAFDFAKDGIRVNNVCPGYVETQMTHKSFNNPELKQKRDDRIMLPRWAKGNDIANACMFLASEAASYLTGVDLPVDGGFLAKGI